MKSQAYYVNYLKEKAASLSILILEDDIASKEVLTRILCPLFGLCISASTGLEANATLEQNSFDIILTDINLPDINGLDFLTKLKDAGAASHFIVASGYGSAEHLLRAIEIGVDGFIVKPIILENLLSALYKTVSQIYKQKELHQSRLELLAANEQTNALLDMQDRFIKDALHEINTPLAVIMTTLELLDGKCAHNHLLDRIDAASRTLKASFEDLIYHTINGQAQIKVEAIDLVEFIAQRVEYFRPIINASALSVNINLPDEKLPILINPVKLQRLIDNTISNAIKYSYRNPGIITANLSSTKSQYIFSVKNFGPKIENTESIFNRFYRESTQAKGYGLGLGIVKQICEEENIDIKVESSAKSGTTFTYKFNKKANNNV